LECKSEELRDEIVAEAKQNVWMFRFRMNLLRTWDDHKNSVRDELAIERKQLVQLEGVFRDYESQQATITGEPISYDERIVKLNNQLAPLDRRIEEVLGKSVYARVQQIVIQHWYRSWDRNKSGLRTPLLFLAQQEFLIGDELKESERVYNAEFAEYVEMRSKARREMFAEILEVLPEAKRTAFMEMVGEPIDWYDPDRK
jgi:hypothetical protein